MPQFSDALSSSLYEGDAGPSDNLQFYVPDDTPLFTPIPSGSQQTFDSAPDSDFVRPAPLVPKTLTRVNPNRVQSFVLYEDMSNDVFVAWWLTTDFGRKKRIHWDGKLRADCWKHFAQVADVRTGKPAVMCNRCKAILDHPANKRAGTSTMDKHLKAASCRHGATAKMSVKDMLGKAVYSLAHT